MEQAHETRHTERSAELFARARRLIPGGVNSPVRAFNAVGGTPHFIDRGHGPYLWDVDGNQYIDYVMSWGPLIHGHAYAPVVDAVRRASELGTSFGAPIPSEIELAEIVVDRIPSVEMVRFLSSGTEATMSALRLARAATGRDLVVKFSGNYHGHVDALLAQAGSGSLTLGLPSSPGVPQSAAALTLVVAYNDVESLRQVFRDRGSEVAAVIVEPIAGNMGVVLPAPGFLQTTRALTRDAGALLIFDEVITGFRVHHGGAQALLDVHPDITTMGKIVGGGLPVGAYGGQRALMEMMAPEGPVYQAGTLSGNPVAMAAGLATLQPLADTEFYSRLLIRTEQLAHGLESAAREVGIPVTVNWCTGMLTLFFASDSVTDLAAAQKSDTVMYGRFFHAMLKRGVALPPSQFEAWMLSSVHSSGIVDRTIETASEALRAL